MFTKLIKAILLTGVCTLAALLPACTPSGPRVVDYPWINYSNNSTIDISSVELTDSNTVLHINAHYIPNYWIKIASDGYLLADGKKYPIIATDGIELDKEFWMPESGHADFRVIFQPLPFSTKKFDYIESESSGAFMLYGVDLTGNKVDEYPEGLPKEFKKTFADGNVPDPIFEMGKTTINFHLLPNDAPFQPDLTMYVHTMSDTQEEYPITFDSEGNGSVSFEQYGSASAFVAGDNSTYAILTLAPGETIDCYIDTRLSGNLAMRNRENHPHIYHRSIHNGKYSNFDLMKSQLRDYYGFQLHTGVFADYHMTGAEYMDMVKSRYLAQSDTIMHADIPDMAKEYAMLQLQGNVLEAIANYRYFLGHNYRYCKKDWRSPVPADSIKATLTESDFAEVTKWFDAANPRLLMAGTEAGNSNWNAYGAKGDLSKSMNMFISMADKAKKQQLQQADIDSLKSLSNPFFAAACDSIQQRAIREILRLQENSEVSEIPDVDDDKLFDAILEPHKGKVVVVDLWNTWCAPCRSALKENEPLKSTELGNDDIVWIYIADESSDPVKYLDMIQNIKGIHFKLSNSQISAIRNRFNVDGIPYYILVDRQGKAEGRPDIRNHSKYVSAIKALL